MSRVAQSRADKLTVESTARSAVELAPVPEITGEERVVVARLVGRYARDEADRLVLLGMLLGPVPVIVDRRDLWSERNRDAQKARRKAARMGRA